MPMNATSLVFLLFYGMYLLVGLYALVAVIRGMRALAQIPEHLRRIESLLEGRLPSGGAPQATPGDEPYYPRYDVPDDRAL